MRTRLPGIIAAAVLGLVALGACGGGSEPLTTEEYAEGFEKAHADAQKDAERIGEDLRKGLENSLEDTQEVERILSSDEAWSEEDIEVMGQFAEDILRFFKETMEHLFGFLGDYRDAVADLRPPEPLADLHDAFIAGIDEVLELRDQFASEVDDIDTDIESQEDYIDFLGLLGGIDAFTFEPGSDFDEACFVIRNRLEEELGRDVAICD